MRLAPFLGRAHGLQSGVGSPDPLVWDFEFDHNDVHTRLELFSQRMDSGHVHHGYRVTHGGVKKARLQISQNAIWDLIRAKRLF